MNISKAALENNRVTILVVLMIAIMGLVGYSNLSRNAMPPFTIRVASVVTSFPGASAERVEELVTERIERVAQELAAVKQITSESRTGLSVVNVELEPSVIKENMQPVWDKLRRKMEELAVTMPDGVGTINVKDDGLGVVYGIQVGLTGGGYQLKDLKEKAEDIRDDLVKLEDAAEVKINGLRTEQIYVEFDNARLARYGLSANELQRTISATNIVFPGGDVGLGDQRVVLEPTGNFESLADLENIIIQLNQTETAKLGEIAKITRGYPTPAERIVRVDGQVGLVVGVAVKEGANLIQLGEQVDERIAIFNQTLPVGMKVERIASQDTYVSASVSGFLSNVLQSVGIVLVVMFLFLGWRTGLVVASLIPLAIIMTLLLMNVFDVGLNQVTLAALIMALGMLVDNAIVISEAMMVRMEEGMKPRDAAYAATSELAIPLLISSLTTSAAFLAFFLAENTMGEMMGPLFVVITFALLSSWIMAMTVVAMLGVALIRVKQPSSMPDGDEETARASEALIVSETSGDAVFVDTVASPSSAVGSEETFLGADAGASVGGQEEQTKEKPDIFARLNKHYGNLIYTALKRPWLTLALIIGMFIGSLFLFPLIPFTFFPDSDRNLITMDIDLPLGTDIGRTADIVAQIETYINESLLVTGDDEKATGITDFTSFISEGPQSYDLGYQPGEANSGYAHLLMNTSSYEANRAMIRKLEDYTFENFPDADISVGPLGSGGGGGADVAVRVSGDDVAVLYGIADDIKREMTGISVATNISDDWGPKSKKVVIDIDQDKANRAGVTNQDIAVSLRTSLSGFNAGSFREGEESLPIMMRGIGAEAYEVQDLKGLNVFAQATGNNVPLTQVAEVDVAWQYAKIIRRDLYRTLTISADALEGATATDLTSQLVPKLKEMQKDWPIGYKFELGGESERSAEAMMAVANKLPLAGFIIILLLMVQFNSFRKMGIVLATIPLGIIGVIIGLLLFQSYFGFMAFLGVISLAGILINNAIVLLDRIEIEEKAGKHEFHAIIDACQQRFRPILLTTFTTALGLIPLYLGGGLMWEPMAISIMIGLLFATVITLLFVPVVYKLLFRIREGGDTAAPEISTEAH
ncbi:efflux RND transporter permease subunit [Neolewinella antarctica]|uniref:Multidrug efflux pump subunit AcrB n=1 Tax=Neolewinella antarctica TaxID=442734 RepID=A0ABX0X9J4_9BACT|nr:efflux RND transporter permease subunit [Neolewinella antarctica]NJC25902.1 multidrug efflux pump subunit AcrB [Neolewinella antarctica]